jgi:hypothetical protein
VTDVQLHQVLISGHTVMCLHKCKMITVSFLNTRKRGTF